MLGWIAAAVLSFFILGYTRARLLGWTQGGCVICGLKALAWSAASRPSLRTLSSIGACRGPSPGRAIMAPPCRPARGCRCARRLPMRAARPASSAAGHELSPVAG